MKEFVNKIMVCDAFNIPATIQFPYSEFEHLHSNVEIVPNFNPKVKNGNNYYEFSLRATFDALSEDVKTLLKNKRPICLLLFDDFGNHYQIGNSEIPVLAIINTIKFNDGINFEADLLNIPY